MLSPNSVLIKKQKNPTLWHIDLTILMLPSGCPASQCERWHSRAISAATTTPCPKNRVHTPKRCKWKSGLGGEGGRDELRILPGFQNMPGFSDGAQVLYCTPNPTGWTSILPATLGTWADSKFYSCCATHQTNLSPCLLLKKCHKLCICRRKPKGLTSSYVGSDVLLMKFTSVFLFCKITVLAAKSAISCYLFKISNTEVFLFSWKVLKRLFRGWHSACQLLFRSTFFTYSLQFSKREEDQESK